MWCVRKYPVIYGCNLRQSLGWPEQAPSTKPCALRALDSPHRGDLSIHKLLIPMSLEDRRPFKTRVPAIGTTLGVLCTPRQSSHSGQYLQESGQGQGRPPELLTSPPPTRDSPLPSRIKQHHMGVPHGKTPSTIHIIQTSITHHITRNICNYDGVKCKQADRRI